MQGSLWTLTTLDVVVCAYYSTRKGKMKMSNDEVMNRLLKLTEEVAEYRTFFNVLSTKVTTAKDNKRIFVEVNDIAPIMEAFKKQDKDINIITFDNCEDMAYES